MAGNQNSGRKIGSKDSVRARRDRLTKKIIELKSKGVANTDIAKATGYDVRTINTTLKKFEGIFTELKNVKDYDANKGDILSAAQLAILKSMMSQDKMEKATLNQSAYAYQVLHNAGRLERGQATAITATYSKVVTEDVTNNRTIDITPDKD